MNTKIRLQKVIANAGISSRREAERMIREGLVTVNGEVVTELGTQVDPEDCHIKVRGKLIRRESKKVYLMLHKPDGYVTTLKDPQGRPTVMDLLHKVSERVFPVGRLDFHSEGLLLITNDGELANSVMHPKYHVPKTYQVKVKGKPSSSQISKVGRGIRLKEGLTAPAEIQKVKYLSANTNLEIIISEGKKRQIRRMFEKIGHPVLRLKRVRIGPIRLGKLAPGEFRKLETRELDQLKSGFNKKS
jgi:23S rRNA pseudouridine2605 synthase